jgi:hypothetical protein
MSKIEKPEDLVVVSRREWLRITTLAAAALAGPSVASAGGTPPDDPCQTCFFSVDGKDCLLTPFDFLNVSASDQGVLSCEYGLLAAFLSCVTRDDTNNDVEQILMGMHDDITTSDGKTLSAALIEKLHLDPGAWSQVKGFALDKQNHFTLAYQGLRGAGRSFWTVISNAYNGRYATGHCVQNLQALNVSLIPGRFDSTSGLDTKGSKLPNQPCASPKRP